MYQNSHSETLLKTKITIFILTAVASGLFSYLYSLYTYVCILYNILIDVNNCVIGSFL